ncbi:Dynamin like protein [Entamoeba marina]
MKNRPTAEEPLCRFKREDSMEFESPISVGLLNQEIVRRTDEVCGRGENVSKKPITLRVDYKYSSNLTIIDTPGFRIGGDQHIKYEIEEMVKELIQVKGRMVICLEQSTVEWANTVSRPFVLTLDPKLERTVLIQTKFDNRVKEFTKGEMANKYLIGEDITKRKKPYFISLPIRRGLSKEKYLVEIRERYLEDYKKLLMVDFDEKTFLQNIGMVRVKDVLEKELLKRYSSQLKPTMDYLRNEIIKTDKSVNAYELELSRTSDLGDIKSRVLRYVSTFNTSVEKLITGECGVEPDQFGQTIRDEIEGSGVGNWPNFDFDFNIENNGLKLYGGAQYERLMKEIEYVMYSREIPLPTVDEVCVTLGMKQIGSSFGGIDRAASGIIKSKANGVVIPVVGMALRRIEYVFDRLYEIAIAYVSQTSNDKYGGDQFTIFSGFKTFQHKLKEVFYKYVEERRNECYKQLTQDFGSFTATVDWQILTTGSMHQDFSLSRTNSFNSTMDAPKTNEKSNSTETTRERVEKMMKERMENSENLLKEMRNVKMWDVKGETYQKLCEISERLFAVIRDTFSGIMRNKINSYFLQPMLSDMKNSLSDTFRLLSDDDLKDIFQKR